MKQIRITLILMVVIVAVLALYSIVATWALASAVFPAEATASYGAEQFHIQLTAQAEEVTP